MTRIRGSLSDLTQGVNSITLGVDAVHQEQERQRQRAVLDWLSPSDFVAQQTDLIGKRQEGTGLWFINSPEFAEWLHGSKHTLFCPGIPGAGKTIIATIVTDHLIESYQEDDIGVACLYCNY